jgi:hypothetical protein
LIASSKKKGVQAVENKCVTDVKDWVAEDIISAAKRKIPAMFSINPNDPDIREHLVVLEHFDFHGRPTADRWLSDAESLCRMLIGKDRRLFSLSGTDSQRGFAPLPTDSAEDSIGSFLEFISDNEDCMSAIYSVLGWSEWTVPEIDTLNDILEGILKPMWVSKEELRFFGEILNVEPDSAIVRAIFDEIQKRDDHLEFLESLDRWPTFDYDRIEEIVLELALSTNCNK